jgi:hypothetical protein
MMDNGSKKLVIINTNQYYQSRLKINQILLVELTSKMSLLASISLHVTFVQERATL